MARLLLIDDEGIVRGALKAVLAQQGHSVREARSPELAGRIAALRPGMKVIFMSGYTEHSVLDPKMLELSKSFIPKPFSPAALVQKIREELGSRR